MGGVACEHVGAQQQDADGAAKATTWQLRQIGGDAALDGGMIKPDIGILHRGSGADSAGDGLAGPGGVTVHQQADHVDEVGLGAAKPILHRQEIDARVLRRARNELQQRRQAAQHLHLCLTAGGPALLRAAAQALQQSEAATGLGIHGELAEPREAHHLARRHHAEHRVAMIAPRLQRRQHRADVVLEEQHGGNDDVAALDVGEARVEQRRVLAPLVGRMNTQLKAGDVAPQDLFRRLRRMGEVAVHRHDDDAERRGVSAHNAPSHRTVFGGRCWQRRAPERRLRCCGEPCRERRSGSS